ncbi:hypothetical protein ABT147_29180 [Streptomyces sp. NPDC001868]|uniref:hypothetical protein n=1 Tax=Streptomyces sp. NPDC001868 TaxID=3154401 RepID=UPI00332BDB50
MPADHAAFRARDRSDTGTDCVFVWVGDIHLRIRLDEAKSAVLVVIGMRGRHQENGGHGRRLLGIVPTTREQRCWVHGAANSLDAMPRSAQSAAKSEACSRE